MIRDHERKVGNQRPKHSLKELNNEQYFTGLMQFYYVDENIESGFKTD